MLYKQGDIVLVGVPFTDLSKTKKRPALLLSANWYNQSSPDCILVPITSLIRDPLPRQDVLIMGNTAKESGLLYDSAIRTGKPFTLDQNLIIRVLGQLPLPILKQAVQHTGDAIDLPNLLQA